MELKQIICVKTNLLITTESENGIAKFISSIRSYIGLTEFTPDILNSFIDEIYIGKQGRIDVQRVQEVKIIYKLIGAVNIPQ